MKTLSKNSKRNWMSLLAVASLAAGASAGAVEKTAEKKALPHGVMKKTELVSAVAPLDPAKSAFNWEGRKIAGPHNGTIALKEGTLEVKGGQVVGGKAVIDMSTIKDLDLTDAEYNKKLVGHLSSPDFFDVAKFPTASIVVKSVKPGKDGKMMVTADVTIKDVTHPETFPAVVKVADGVASAEGDLVIDRTVYGVKYNSKKFFSLAKLGDKVIEDKFKVSFKIAADLPKSANAQ